MSEKVLIQDLIDLLAQEKKITKREAETFIKALFDLIEKALEQDQYIKIKGLGSFKLIGISSRESVNVNTGERFIIEGHTRISFTPDSTMRDLINKPFAHFETVVLNDEVIFSDTPEGEEEEENLILEGEPTMELSELANRVEISKEYIPEKTIEQHIGESQSEINTMKNPLEDNESLENEEKTVCEPALENSSTFSLKKEKNKSRDNQGLASFVVIVLMVITALSGIIIYVYNPRMLLNLLPESSNENLAKTDSVSPRAKQISKDELGLFEDSIKSDSAKTSALSKQISLDKALKEENKDHIKITEKKDAPLQMLSPKTKGHSQLKTSYSDSVHYLCIGTQTTYTLQPGETLMMVSKRFYGTKALWSYIAEYNREMIKDPDKVPFGIILKIPKLKEK